MEIATPLFAQHFLQVTTLGERLVEARERLGLTQTELADRLGVRAHVMWRYEHDESTPRAERLQKLASILQVEVTWLLTGKSQDEAPAHDPAALKAFLATPAGQGVTEEELGLLRSARFKGPPNERAYFFMLEALRATDVTH